MQKKTIVFEGCGMSFEPNELSDVGNYRIRSTFLNNKGRVIYIELGGHKNEGYLPSSISHLDFPFHVSHCFDLTFHKSNHDPRLCKIQNIRGEYTKENILKLINTKLDCSFEALEVDEKISGLEMKAKFKDDYSGCFKEYAGKDVTLCEFIPCDEGDSDYWVKVKDIEESHLIKSKHFVGFNY